MSSTLAERMVRESLREPCANVGIGNKNLALFLSQRAEIQEALDLGWSVRAIWKHLHKEGKFPGTYECFLNHAKKNLRITKYVSSSSRHPQKTSSDDSTSSQKDASRPKGQEGRVSGFEFKPVFDAKKLYGEEE
ncbi:TraK family protein [Desulfomicrobium orale]|uniref:TraK family protein n=1 Tax=Desulfomicrobium orale TaxID=132132 RepID=UPI0012467D27|nr:TraK family protein [Desulfomicrobium orale]